MTFRTMTETAFTYTRDNSATLSATTIVTPPAGSIVLIQLSSLSLSAIDIFGGGSANKTVTIGGQAKQLTSFVGEIGPFMFHSLLSDGSAIQISISGSGTNSRLIVTGKVFVIPPSN